jgi:glycosyltransferase involved in cell wall biosynthesis
VVEFSVLLRERPMMFRDKKVVVVMPAYNAEKTLEKTVAEIREQEVVDHMILVDDASRDRTAALASSMGDVQVYRHERNLGYGGNQKTCYRLALEAGADVVIMVHPDYQYTPTLIPSIAWMIANDVYPVVLASRILGNGALKGGMPMYKYIANRGLTFIQNVLVSQKLSEYHTGYRAFSREVLERIDLEANSDDFVFDNQMLSQIIMANFPIGEVTCPTKYFDDASSINFRRSSIYGIGVLTTSLQHRLHKWGILRNARYRR